MEDDAVTTVRRDTGDKEMGLDREEFIEEAEGTLDDIQESMYNELEEYLHENIREAESKNEILATIGRHGGYVRTGWCGEEACETEIKDEIAAEIVMTPMEPDEAPAQDTCGVCGEPATTTAYFARSY